MQFPDETICYLYRAATRDYYIPADNAEATAFCEANKLPLQSDDWSAICRAADDIVEVMFDDDDPAYQG
jgi:hypothetical protein